MVHSLITLYSSTETEFATNGLGSLSEAASCVVTEEINGGFELELVYPITGKRYKDLTVRSIIFVKPNPVDPPQAFRIYEISKPINGLTTYYASHISYDLSGIPILPFMADTCVLALQGLKNNSVVNHNFDFWTDKAIASSFKVDSPMSLRSSLGGTQGSILDIYGGEYKFDNFLVKLYTHRGSDRGVVIRYGKNLIDIKQEETISKMYTAVLPYWKDIDGEVLITLPEKYIPIEGNFNFNNILTLDLSTYFEEEPTEDQLRERATKYIKDNSLGEIQVSLNISFAQLEQTEEYKNLALLERVELGDTIRVEFERLDISAKAKVCKTVYDVLRNRYESVEVGSIRASISDTIVEQDDDFKSYIKQTKSTLQKNIDNATKWITNGRGYMVAVQDEAGNWIELCSLDVPDIETAVNVWRWNNGGFGFSSHGYNGPYSTAITQDGHIVADFITAGTMDGAYIRGDTITGDKIVADAITTEKIQAGAVTANEIASNAITSDKIQAGAVTANEIAAYTITASEIASGAITADKIKAGAITADKLDVTDLSALGATIGGWSITNDGLKGIKSGSLGITPELRANGELICTYITGISDMVVYGWLTVESRLFAGNIWMGFGDARAERNIENANEIHCEALYTSSGTVSKSDENSKNSIELLNRDTASSFIYSLKPSKYKLNDGTSGRYHHGFIAQDVKKSMGNDDWGLYCEVSKREVTKTEDGKSKIIESDEKTCSLRYDELIADLVATVQQQNERIIALESIIKGGNY